MEKVPETHEHSTDRSELVVSLASRFHDAWRSSRKQSDGRYEPRVKKTKHEEWMDTHGTDEVDIANTAFESLPQDWKRENSAAAAVVIDLILAAVRDALPLDRDFIEKASAVVHEQWLERNGAWASEELQTSFADLSEEEKEKDRVQVRCGIAILQEEERIKRS